MKPFGGIMPPLVTPLTEEGRLDEVGLRRLVEYVLAGGVHGVVVLGSSGETALLTPDVRRRALEVVLEAVQGRVPVVAGTGEPGTAMAAEWTREARQAGADAAIVVPPYYFVHDQEAVKRHFRAVREAGQLPVLAYHIPGLTKVPVQVETLLTLAAESTVCGVKDSGGDFSYFQRVVDGTRHLPDFVALQGYDQLIFASLAYGGDGAISVRAQITPAVVVALYESAVAGDWARARALQDMMRQLGPALGQGWHSAIKGALAALGICGPDVAAPNARLSDADLAAQRERLEAARQAGLFDPSVAIRR
jgi:4-hydroxy-tetrahydrodipicolinate synthase